MKNIKSILLWSTAILFLTVIFIIMIRPALHISQQNSNQLQATVDVEQRAGNVNHSGMINFKTSEGLIIENTNPPDGKEKFMLKWKDILGFADKGNLRPDSVVTKTEEEWRKILTPEQYQITRLKGTERAYSSEMCSLFEPGLYACAGCGTLLFDSAEKFESGTGWPSFTQPIKENAIAYHADNSLGMNRIETTCNTCGAHLGHVFPDGPEPGGLRYCINALALKKIKK